eukprot:1142479-Pelagomonas_calceolata.AAC.1
MSFLVQAEEGGAQQIHSHAYSEADALAHPWAFHKNLLPIFMEGLMKSQNLQSVMATSRASEYEKSLGGRARLTLIAK